MLPLKRGTLHYPPCSATRCAVLCCAVPLQDILDVGAATGLSSLALLRAFPDAHVTGVDLSPYFLAVGHHLQRQREVGVSSLGAAARAEGGAVPPLQQREHGGGMRSPGLAQLQVGLLLA